MRLNQKFWPIFVAVLGLSTVFISPWAKAISCGWAHRSNQFKVAAVQYPIAENLTPEQFYSKVESYIRQAKTAGNDLVILPELLVLDLIQNPYSEPYQKQLLRIAREITPVYFERMKTLAQELEISILAGTSPREVGSDIVNTALLVFPDGKKILQDKVYPTPDEARWGWKGSDAIKVFDAPWGRTTILICHDCEFPVLSNHLARFQPELILVPSMTGDRSGLHRVQWTAQARAIEHHAWVVHTGTTQAGAEAYYGQASIISPQSSSFPTDVIRGVPNVAQLVSGTIDFNYLRAARAQAGIYPGRDQELRAGQTRVEWAIPE